MSSSQVQRLMRGSCGHYGPDNRLVGYEQGPTGTVAVWLCLPCRQAQGLEPVDSDTMPEQVELKALREARASWPTASWPGEG